MMAMMMMKLRKKGDDDADRSPVHGSVNGTSIMKQDDGDGDMFVTDL